MGDNLPFPCGSSRPQQPPPERGLGAAAHRDPPSPAPPAGAAPEPHPARSGEAPAAGGLRRHRAPLDRQTDKQRGEREAGGVGVEKPIRIPLLSLGSINTVKFGLKKKWGFSLLLAPPAHTPPASEEQGRAVLASSPSRSEPKVILQLQLPLPACICSPNPE